VNSGAQGPSLFKVRQKSLHLLDVASVSQRVSALVSVTVSPGFVPVQMAMALSMVHEASVSQFAHLPKTYDASDLHLRWKSCIGPLFLS
jgi:hypothetical protein